MSGVLEELEHSKKYAVYFIEEAKIEKRAKIEMARAMKQKGIDLQTIEEISGLSMEEIEKL